MSDPAIRVATAEDVPDCAAILKAWMERADWMDSTQDIGELEAFLRKRLPMREAYVIGDPVAGYLSLEPDISHIWGLYVATPRRGLGRALLDHVKQGRTFLQLNTHEPNTDAQAFYVSQGFAHTGDYWMGWDGIDETRMEWRA